MRKRPARWHPNRLQDDTCRLIGTTTDTQCMQENNVASESTVTLATTTMALSATVAAAVAAAMMIMLPKHFLLYKHLRHSILRLNRYIGGNTQRCWMVLFLAIILDTTSTITMKQAQYDRSLTKLLLAYLGYFIR
jgi:hypothetical protein